MPRTTTFSPPGSAAIQRAFAPAVQLAIVLSLGWVGGCQSSARVVKQSGKAVARGSQEARSLLGTVDPTGVVSETAARQRAWEELRVTLLALDVEAWNAVARRLGEAADSLAVRIEAIDPHEWQAIRDDWSRLTEATRAQVEAAELGRTSDAVLSLALTAEKQISQVDTSQVDQAIAEIRQAAEQMNRKVEELATDLQVVVSAIPTEDFATTIQRLRKTAETVESGAVRLPEVLAGVESAAHAATRTLNIAAGVLAAVGMAALGTCTAILRRRRG